jgi:Ca2+-binding EF-hand superfamily protein
MIIYQLISNLGLDKYDLISIYKFFDKFDNNKDGFLDTHEFSHLLKDHFSFTNNRINSLICRFSDKSNNNLISVTNLVLLLNYYSHFFERKSSMKFNTFNKDKIEEICSRIHSISSIYEYSKVLQNEFSDYEVLLIKGFYSGLITYAKFIDIQDFKVKLEFLQKNFTNYCDLLANQVKLILSRKLRERLIIKQSNVTYHLINFNEIEVNNFIVNVLDPKEMRELETINNSNTILII